MCLGPSQTTAHVTTTTTTSAAPTARADKMKRSRHSISTASTTSTSWSMAPASAHRDSVSGRWVDDADCPSCRKCERAFTLVNRRHHCRICGDIFCHACSRTRMVISTAPGEPPRRQRVCDRCAAHAQSHAALYDIDDRSEAAPTDTPSSLQRASQHHFSDLSTSELVVDTTTTDVVRVSEAPSVNFLLASIVCFVASFWFLKDEVTISNPAIWILFAGFLKNLHQLLVTVRTGAQTEQQRAEQHTHVELKHVRKDTASTSAAVVLPVESDAVAANTKKSTNPLGLSDGTKGEMLDSARKAMDYLWEVGMSQDNWTPEPNSFPIDDVVLHSRDGKPVRVYKCEAVFDLAPDELFDVLHGQFETSSSWNVTAAENKIVQSLSEETDVVHVTSAPALGGMISSRDFVNIRTWKKKEGGYIIGSNNAGKNLIKPAKGITRGENGMGGFIILPHETSPFKSRFIWILNCDIKGYFPGSLIRKGSLSEMCCFVRNLRRHLAATIGSDSAETTP